MKTLLYENETIDQFRSELSRARKFHLAFGQFSTDGLHQIHEDLIGCLQRGGYGRVLIGVDMLTDPNVIQEFRDLETTFKQRLDLKRFQSGARRMFHVKMAMFERRDGRRTAILGSSNLTLGGLVHNLEANVFLDTPGIVSQLFDYFEEQFVGGYARRIDDIWLDQYRKIWKERQKAQNRLRRLRERVRRSRAKRDPSVKLPNRIRNHVFAFTGKIEDWPRERKLYPAVKRLGGRIAPTADSIGYAECLVHAELPSGKKTTLKLQGAHQRKIPIITEDEFFRIFDKQKRR